MWSIGSWSPDLVADGAAAAQHRYPGQRSKFKVESSECISLHHHKFKKLLSITIVNRGPSIQWAEVSWRLSNSLRNSTAGAWLHSCHSSSNHFLWPPGCQALGIPTGRTCGPRPQAARSLQRAAGEPPGPASLFRQGWKTRESWCPSQPIGVKGTAFAALCTPTLVVR